MEHSESIKTIAPAIVAAQARIEGAAKDKKNPHFGHNYADLASVMFACKAALNDNGVAVIQTPVAAEDKGTLILDTVLLHNSGEWISGRVTMPLGKADPQGYGSALTYARRYSLAAMVGVCPEDDDAEGAMGRTQQSQPKPKTTPPPPPSPKELTDAEREAAQTQEYFQQVLDPLATDRKADPDKTRALFAQSLAKARRKDTALKLVDFCNEFQKKLVNGELDKLVIKKG